MGRELTHDEIRELLGAYALDAIPQDEREATARHLAECEECRAEASAHREAVAHLIAEGRQPDTGLWDRLSAALEAPPPTLRLGPVSDTVRRGRTALLTGAAVVIAAAGMVAFFTLKVSDQNRRIEEMANAVEDRTILRAAYTAMTDPAAEQLPLLSPDRSMVVYLVLLPDGHGYLMAGKLRTLPRGRLYQMWALLDDSPVSAALLGRRPDVSPFWVHRPVAGFAITDESAPGARTPSGKPVVIGYLPDADR